MCWLSCSSPASARLRRICSVLVLRIVLKCIPFGFHVQGRKQKGDVNGGDLSGVIQPLQISGACALGDGVQHLLMVNLVAQHEASIGHRPGLAEPVATMLEEIE